MLSIVNQNGDTKLDVTLYFKKRNVDGAYVICSVDYAYNTIYLGMYSTKEQCDKVFEEMLSQEFRQTTLYRLPEDNTNY